MTRWQGLLQCALLLLFSCSPVAAQGYQVIRITTGGPNSHLYLSESDHLAWTKVRDIAIYEQGTTTYVGPQGEFYSCGDVNSWGQVAFSGWPNDNFHASTWLYTPWSPAECLSEGYKASGPRLNDAGTVVWSDYGTVWYCEGGVSVMLSDDGEYPDVSEGGHVVWATNSTRAIAIWERGSLTTLPGRLDDQSRFSVNALGHVAYVTQETSGYAINFYDGATTRQIATCRGRFGHAIINDADQVLMRIDDIDEYSLELWSAEGSEVVYPGDSSYYDMNNLGDIVYQAGSTGPLKLLTADGVMHVLEANAGQVRSLCINDRGHAAWINDSDVYFAVPEPATVGLMAVGLAALAARARRRRRGAGD